MIHTDGQPTIAHRPARLTDAMARATCLRTVECSCASCVARMIADHRHPFSTDFASDRKETDR